MMLKQLTVFLENRPGHLHQVCSILAEAGISIETLTLADTSEFGILRLIVREWEDAMRILEEAGAAVKVLDVTAIEVPDRPGGLEGVLKAIDNAGISIEYMYAFSLKRGENAVLIFRFGDPERAIQTLSDAGISVLSSVDLYR